MGIGETNLAFIPRELEIPERPDLKIFALNIVFASLRLLRVAEYVPDISTLKETPSFLKLRYFNTASRDWWIEVQYSKDNGWFQGDRYHKCEWLGGASGINRDMFFAHLTMADLETNEPIDATFTEQFAESLREFIE